ncbi:CRISPR-associated protein, NE0113 family [Thioalkalivibrio sulfidiphilus HL-EbGr7]|uniref:CRISPR-associated protein, NE0113 family n=1 Tax=Thioalkalivibrio sulfidiphilus (strain HL-EbGR7) TaxID=396588 RepID=B8GSG7_THISH|nr:CRISPR-associated ring nuclease Csm6 [Thioalkalivibrio sulfidiphilus]ACL72871.1 CRISPR-associated protein, NE0113 family [Thioalkalivibrio sulfidiphilus HL-EbGr7]
MKKPAEFPKRILVAVTGLSPQILTETLYALATQAEPFIPTEIHLITTSEGAKRADLTLLSPDPGWFHRLRKDYGLPDIRFDKDTIHVIRNADGLPMDDIRSEADNQHAADTILDILRQLTADEHSAVHVSIAGGRKTMGYYAGYALSLCGRPQDRLSHVLVSEPFESNKDFYYPTPYRQVIYTREPERRPIDAQEAKVSLGLIPFVRMRQGLPDELRSGRAGFSDVIQAAQRALEPEQVKLTFHEGYRITAGDKTFNLEPIKYSFYRWLAWRCASGLSGVRYEDDGLREELLEKYAEVIRDGFKIDKLGTETLPEINGKSAHLEQLKVYLEQTKSRTNKAIMYELGSTLSKPYLIESVGKRGETRYQLCLPPDAIHFA